VGLGCNKHPRPREDTSNIMDISRDMKAIENYRAVFDMDMLHCHSMKVMHIFIVLFSKEGIKDSGDRFITKNMYVQIYAAKFLLDEQWGRYATKTMLEQMLKRMEEKLEEYDSAQRETRLERKRLKAHNRR
jgi:hypothetical protein